MTRMQVVVVVLGEGESKINASGIKLRFLRMPRGTYNEFLGFFYNELQVCNLPFPSLLPPFPQLGTKEPSQQGQSILNPFPITKGTPLHCCPPSCLTAFCFDLAQLVLFLSTLEKEQFLLTLRSRYF